MTSKRKRVVKNVERKEDIHGKLKKRRGSAGKVAEIYDLRRLIINDVKNRNV